MDKTKADILYESLANFTDEEGAIECGAKMRDFARELERENAKLLGLLGEVFQCIEYAERCGGLDSVTEIKVRRALAALPNV
jgi:hypothetical protein